MLSLQFISRLLFAWTLLLCLPYQPEAQVFTEDFGSSFNTSQMGFPNWASCRSKSSNSSTGDCAGVGDYGAYIWNGENLTTESITVPGTGYCLSFEYTYNSASNLPQVQIGTGGLSCFSASYTSLGTLSQTGTCTSASFSLDAYAGQTIYIRFLAGSSFTTFYLDEIVVGNTGCSGGGGGGCNTVVFSDDFGDGSVNAPQWTTVNSTFTSSFGVCTGGNSRAWFSTFSSPAQVISQSIDLSGASNAEFSMDYSMAAAAFTFQCAYVEVSTNGGLTWTNTNAPYTDPDGTCQSVTQSLNAFLGQTIQLRIRRASTTQTFYFDNVQVCTDGGSPSPKLKWADNFNDNDLVLDYAGNDGDEDCSSCGNWVLGNGASLTLVPSGGWNGNTNRTEAFPDNMANVYYVRLDRDEWIESPTMDLSSFESLKISFYAKSSSSGTGGGDNWSFSDRLRLQIWDGSAWQTIRSLRDDLNTSWNGIDDYISPALPFNYFCFSAYRSTSSPGNHYYTSSPNVNSAWFHSDFKFRVLFEGGFSGSPFAWVDDFTFRADADGYSTMIPCGISFWNEPQAAGYGPDPGTTGNHNAEKGVELELDNAINIPPVWASEADDGDTITQSFGPGESERVVFAVLSEQQITAAFPRVHFYAPSTGWQSAIMSRDNSYAGPGWLYYSVQYISCDLASSTIAEPTDDYRYYFSFEYGIEFMPVFYHLNTSGIEVGGGATSSAEVFNAPDVISPDSCGNATLPVSWLGFEGKWENGINYLQWETGFERQVDGFEVQRQIPGGFFETIGFVQAKGAHGTGAAYRFEDPVEGSVQEWRYRIRQVEIDGGADFSNTILIRRPDADHGLQATIVPNPSGKEASVSLASAEFSASSQILMRVSNAVGKLVYEGMFPVSGGNGGRVVEYGTSALNRLELPLPAHLAPGLYFIEVQLQNSETGNRSSFGKWVKQE